MNLFLGMGKTGFDLAHHFFKFNQPNNQQSKLYFWDSRKNPPFKEKIENLFKDNQCYFLGSNDLNDGVIEKANQIYLSSAIEPKEIAKGFKNKDTFNLLLQKTKTDLDLFCEYIFKNNKSSKLISITGTNGKSTICHFLNHFFNHAQLKSKIIGNFGPGFLQGIEKWDDDFFIAELSSFQLYFSKPVVSDIAAISNIYPEHLNWHGSYLAYKQAKIKIFEKAKKGIIFQSVIDDQNDKLILLNDCDFSELGQFDNFNNQNLSNKLNFKICYAIAKQLLKPQFSDAQIDAFFQKSLNDYQALSYRMQKFSTKNKVDWFNDSKATNTHSLIAALKYFYQNQTQHQNNLFLIVGGEIEDLKGLNFCDVADFIELNESNNQASNLLLKQIAIYGSAQKIIFENLKKVKNIPLTCFQDLKKATDFAYHNSNQLLKNNSNKHAVVLFSPGVASLAMYQNYAHRGEIFNSYVQSLDLENSK